MGHDQVGLSRVTLSPRFRPGSVESCRFIFSFRVQVGFRSSHVHVGFSFGIETYLFGLNSIF